MGKGKVQILEQKKEGPLISRLYAQCRCNLDHTPRDGDHVVFFRIAAMR